MHGGSDTVVHGHICPKIDATSLGHHWRHEVPCILGLATWTFFGGWGLIVFVSERCVEMIW